MRKGEMFEEGRWEKRKELLMFSQKGEDGTFQRFEAVPLLLSIL